MNHFLRALKEAWRHWFVLAAALVFSIFAAALWGANIAALFPVIETTLNGRSIPEGNRQRVRVAEKDIADYRAQIAQLQLELPQVPPEPRKQKRREIEYLK